MKYTQKHCPTVSCHFNHMQRVLCDVISRSHNRLIVTFGEIHTLLKEYRTRKGMKDKRNHHGESSLEQNFDKSVKAGRQTTSEFTTD